MKKTILRTISVALVLVMIMAMGAGCFWNSYNVIFDLNGGTLISGETAQTVRSGQSAVPPVAENGNRILSWDTDYTNVQGDMIVTAVWTKQEMNSTDLAAYVQERTVTVSVNTVNGNTSTGSGFFIDDQGTIVTNYHVIDMGSSMSVQVANGGSYDVQEVIDFSNVYDLAILKIDLQNNEYLLLSDEPPRTGEQVYAVGSALGVLTGTFTAGTISSTSRKVGLIDCVQMDAAISNGNSGGPLVNVYGEVVGVNTFSYTRGENLNLAIKIDNLDRLARDKHYTVSEFREWYNLESSRSWSPMDGEGNFYYSLVNTYQHVTGANCISSCSNTEEVSGYIDCYPFYKYNYSASQYDTYTAYLKANGFEYQENEVFGGGTSYYYYNEKDNILVDLFIVNDSTQIWIWVSKP